MTGYKQTKTGNPVPLKERTRAILSLFVALIVCFSLIGCAQATPEQLAEKRAISQEQASKVFIRPSSIVVVNDNGTVSASGVDKEVAKELAQWSDVKQVLTASAWCVVGLKSDGSVISAKDDDNAWCDVSDWSDITQISCGIEAVYGLRSDGTVVAVGADNEGKRLEVQDWENVADLYSCPTSKVMCGRTADGKILDTYDIDQEKMAGWTDVVDFKFSRGAVLALRSDGTVYSKDYSDTLAAEISQWEDIIQVAAAGEYGLAAGLRADGTVVFTGDLDKQGQDYDEESLAEIADWKNVAAIAGYNSYLLGLTADGRVLFAGRNGATKNSAYNTSGYRDVVAIFAGDPSFVALKADGTLEGYVNTPISDFDPLWKE